MKKFTQTSDEPYDRHRYKLVLNNGQSFIFETYQEAQEAWWSTPVQFLSHVEALDRVNS